MHGRIGIENAAIEVGQRIGALGFGKGAQKISMQAGIMPRAA